MIHSLQIGYDLKDVLDTLEELKRAVEQQARVRVQLEAENASLHRRLLEALAAERRQRCRATASRTFAKRAQAATQPVIAAQKELVSLKRELSIQNKNFQEERKMWESKICALERELTRTKEESEAALAAAEFAKDRPFEVFTKELNQTVTSTGSTVPSIIIEGTRYIEPPPVLEPAQPVARTLLPPARPKLPQQNNGTGNTLWTGSGQLVWNPPSVILTPTIRPTRPLLRPNKPAPPSRYQPVAGFQTASQLMMASQGDEQGNPVSDTQVSQSDCDKDNEPSQTMESDDDCVIIGNEVINPVKHEEPVAFTGFEPVKTEIVEDPPGILPEERIEAEDDASTAKTPAKKPRKKRRMFITPLYDDYNL